MVIALLTLPSVAFLLSPPAVSCISTSSVDTGVVFAVRSFISEFAI